MDLTGTWRAAVADDDVRRDAVRAEFDDERWTTVVVPGHWREHPVFAGHDGPVMYRRRYRADLPEPGRRRWIELDGIFYQADVWLDGAYLGDPEGYFVRHAFEVTPLDRLGEEHVLAVEVACPPASGRGRVVTGAFQADRGPASRWNPGGLWGPVRLTETGPARLDRLRVLCRDADASRAHLLLRTTVDLDEQRPVVVRTHIDGELVHEIERSLAAGLNELDWTIDVPEPRLWWPRALGGQELTDVTVDVLVDGEASDVATRRTGLRQVAWSRWICSVNGERLALKGADLLPTRLALGSASVEEVHRHVALAIEAGLDLLRVHGHIARPELYRAADEAGLLLLQDFPLSGRHARSVKSQAVDQARAAVDLLGHHPSIVMWIAHDEPDDADRTGEIPRPTTRLRRAVGAQLPSWNRSVLDHWVKRAIEKADATRPCVPHSGVGPHLPQLDGTDSHLWFGWRRGEMTDLERTARRLPRLVRFVSEFGAQSVPELDLGIDRFPDLDEDHLREELGAEVSRLLARVPPTEHRTLRSWSDATRGYQAELVRHHVETLRRLKYRPTGGFCVFSLNEPAPSISFSLVDHTGRPKPAFHALRKACAPVILVADRPPSTVTTGERLNVAVHVVNDLRRVLENAEVTAIARWTGGEQRWRFGGDVPADECVRAGRIDLEVPETSGTLTLDLRLDADGVTATNRYTTVVTVTP